MIRRVTFSLDADGHPLACGVGCSHLGPAGFLDCLEEQAGLPASCGSSMDRLLMMETALSSFRGAFFTDAFETDPLATARLLLSLRDELIMGGWAEKSQAHGNTRLATMADLEKIYISRQGNALGVPDRICRLINMLDEIDFDIAIDCIELRDDLPLLWIKLLDGLEARFVDDSMEKPLADSNSDLGRFQQWLKGDRDKQAQWSNDGTIKLSTAYSRVRLEQERAAWAVCQNETGETVLVADPAELGGVRQWISGLGKPSLNDRVGLVDNPLFQLPGMVLALQWQPFDPQAWIEFLTHPFCPIHSGLRWALANALGRQPSRSGTECEWAGAIRNWQDQTPEKERAETEFWLGLEPLEQEPAGSHLAGILRRLMHWRSGGGVLDRRFREVAASLAQCFAREDRITRLRSQQMVREWQKTLGNADLDHAELGSVSCLSSLSQVTESSHHLSLWLPESSSVGVPVWTACEVKCLKDQDVKIQDRWAEARRHDRWLEKKISCIQQTLTVFRLPQRNGQSQPMPTIQILLEACFRGFGSVSVHPEPKALSISSRVVPLQCKLPSIVLSQPALLGSRQKESFTSLAKFIQRPDEYVFNYLARWRYGTLMTARTVDNPIARGNLLHRASGEVLEDQGRESEGGRGTALFCHAVNRMVSAGDWNKLGSEGASRWVDQNWDALLEAYAAHYLLPENSAARLELRHVTSKAVSNLVRVFKEAGVVKVENEIKKEGEAFFGQLGGRLDLYLTNDRGKMAVVDLKLGGYEKREKEIRNSNHLQLALYGYLVGKETEVACSYYILGKSRMISPSGNYFAQTGVARSSDDSTEWRGCWDRFEELWRWRRAQFNKGEIMMPVWDGKAETGSPISHWPLFSDLKYPGDYRALTGWEVSE